MTSLLTSRKIRLFVVIGLLICLKSDFRAQVPTAQIFGIGDLPGGAVGSAVRDATIVGGTIYAVGSSVARTQNICTSPGVPAGCLTFPNLDSPVVWNSSTGTLTALPPGPGVDPTTQATNQIFAYAISPDGQSIASQAHYNTTGSTGTAAVRVDLSGGSWTNVNLSSLAPAGASPPNVAYALSDNHNIAYVQQNTTIATRIDVIGTTDIAVPLPTYPNGSATNQSFPIPRGTSSDGNVMVGVASNGGITGNGTNGVAFRFVYGTGPGTTTPIPMLTGGTWNFPVALTPDGRYTVVAGNSSTYPINGQIYLHDATTGATTDLGTPNTAMFPRVFGGVTPDGQVVAVTFGETLTGFLALPVGGRHAYVHNSHGWFPLSSILTANGIDLVQAGWNPADMVVSGIRTVNNVELVYGQGRRRTLNATADGYVLGAQEGFVAQLPAGTLAAFDVPASNPSAVDTSIVGAWNVGDPTLLNNAFVFLADGTYYRIDKMTQFNPNSVGFEHGRYTWGGNGTVITVTPMFETDGTVGSSANAGRPFVLTINGDNATFADAHCPACPIAPVYRISGGSATGSLTGGWVDQIPGLGTMVLVMLGNNTYYYLQEALGDNGAEYGTFTNASGILNFTRTLGQGGGASGATAWTISADDLALTLVSQPPDPPESFTFLRAVHPATVVPVITSALSAAGAIGTPFAPYTITASHGLTFGATGLPAGLGVNASTGVISGTPTVGGHIVATISATNSFGGTGTAPLDLMINNTSAGDDVVVTVPGSPLTLTFDTVNQAGVTEITAANPATAPAPPTGVTAASPSLYFLATSTATYSGQVSACVTTAGSNLQGGVPRLYYHDGTNWVSTGSTVRTNGQVCGTAPGLGYLIVMSDTRFRGIGDLAGGAVGSAVRDATTVGGAIYAVGSSVSRTQNICTSPGVPAGCLTFPNLDSPVAWSSTTGALTALPPGPGVDVSTQATNQIFAYAISPDGLSIAAQSHFNTTSSPGTTAVRVDSTGGTWTNVNLAAPAVAATAPNAPNVAYSLSDDRNIVYAQQNNVRAVRLDVAGATDVVPIPLPPGVATTQSFPMPRGTSSDGNVMVGVASNGPLNANNGVAFRFVYGAGPGTTTRIPLLAGGTWNFPVALTPDGRYTVVAGDTPGPNFNGEIYLHDAVTGTVTSFGTPNSSMVPKMLGGITSDGQALAVTFAGTPGPFLGLPVSPRQAYVHNGHGWWPLTSILAAQGIDLVEAGWNPPDMLVSGIRSVSTDADPAPEVELVFGQGRRRTLNAAGTGYDLGAQEGFVVELPAGTLAAFDVPVVDPAQVDPTIVGAWAAGDPTGTVVTFMADGTYVQMNKVFANGTATNVGMERGRFRWSGNGTAIVMTPMFDTDGSGGGTNSVGKGLVLTIAGDSATLSDPHCPNCATGALARITDQTTATSLTGGWRNGDTSTTGWNLLVLLGDNTYWFAENPSPNSGPSGAEIGTVTNVNGTLTFTRTVGSSGLGNDTIPTTLSADDLTLTLLPSPASGGGSYPFLRVVHPATVVPAITSDATAQGEASAPFSYLITASHGLTFDATGLPQGLSVNTATGVISGAATSTGTFNATVLATNSFGGTGSAPLTITIDNAVSPVAQNGAVTTSEDTPVNGTLVASDPNGDPLSYSLVSNGGLGTAAITNASTGAFTYTPSPNANGTDWITFKANDGTHDSNVATVLVTITAVNDVPVAANGVFATNEDTPASGTLIATDPDNQTLTFSIVTNGSIGTAVITNPATGAFTYTPKPNANGADAFTFKVNDGLTDSNIATVAVTIAAVEDAPVAANAAITTNEDTPFSGTLIATDAESPTVTFSLLSTGTRGTAVLTNPITGAFTYTPNPNANGTDTFTFKANDGALDSNVATVTVTITPVNDLPTANPGSVTTVEDTPVSGTLSATDADNEPLTFTVVSNGSRGTATITNAAGGTFTYTPNPNANGIDTFTFKVNDGTVDSNVATVTVTITAVNDVPVASNATVTTNEDTPLSGTLIATDVESPTLTFTLLSTGTLGTAVLTNASTGAFTYTPNSNANGTDSFTFKASDGVVDSNVATVTVTIVPVNDPPVAVNGTVITNEDTLAVGNLSATDTDSAALTFSLVTNGTLGTAAITNAATGAFTYTPNLNANGTDSFTFKANDGVGNSNVATVTVSIVAVNDAPVATSSSRATTEDTPFGGTLLASDPDSPTLTFSIVSNGSLGIASITDAVTGAFTYTPNPNAFGTDSFKFKANDGMTDSNIATVTVTIAPVNDPPVAADRLLTTNEDTAATGNLTASDPDNTTLTYSIVTNGARGVATITNATTGAFTYTPNANANGIDTFTFKASDGSANSNVATVTVTIVPVNDAPTAASGSVTTTEDTPVSGALVATDVDGQPLTFSIVTNGAKGLVTVTNPTTGAFTYTPNPNANGADSFTFKAGDGTLDSNVATITVTITAVNDAPVAASGTLTTNEDTPVSGTLTAADVDSQALTFAIVANGARGTATITNPATGAFTYTPNPNANGVDTFTFIASDGSLLSVAATVTITINPVNDAPVASSVVLTTTGAPVSGMLAATDVDGDALTYSVSTQPSQGTVAITNPATGAFTYTPNAGATGYDPFTFQVSDGHGGTGQGTGMMYVVAASPQWPGQTVRASVSSAGTQSDNYSYGASVSADGRYVAFYSYADNLVPGDTNGTSDIFVRDRQTNQITRVSVASDGSQAHGTSYDPTISADGRFIAFASNATNLVPGITNGVYHVFVRDRQTGQTTPISVASDGSQAVGDSGQPVLSADGRFVAFSSGATNLVPGDNNNATDVFVRDRQTGQTTRVSIGSDGTQGNRTSAQAAITADGRFVAFRSSASNLVPGDTNNADDVFVRDLWTGQTTRVSVASDGTEGNSSSNGPAISADGRFIAFTSSATNLVPSDTNGNVDVFVHDQLTGATTRVSVASNGTEANNTSYEPSLSADGRFVAFTSYATNLYAGDTNYATDVFVHDRQTGQTRNLSVSSGGASTFYKYWYSYCEYGSTDYWGNFTCYRYHSVYLYPNSSGARLSADGRFVAFTSDGFNLVANDTNDMSDVFVVGGASVSPLNDSYRIAGGQGTVNVSYVYSGTSWSAVSKDFWITITAGSSGSGNGTVTYTVAPNATGVNRTGTLVVATQTVTIQQSGNAAPVSQNGTLTTNEDTPAGGTLVATDANGDALTYSLVANGTKGSAVITNASTGAFTYTPNANANGADSFTFKANDGTVDSNVATVSVTITPVNDAPVANAGVLTTNEDTPGSGTLVATDVDGPTLTYSLVSTGTLGTAVLTDAATGAFTYTPNANANGSDTFTFKANDGTLDSNVATVTVTITPVNDAPVASNGSFTTDEDTPYGGLLVATDVDNPNLMYTLVSTGTIGTAVISNPATGAFTYTPNPNAYGMDSVTFKVSDGTLFSNIATISITVNPVIDPQAPLIVSVPAGSAVFGSTFTASTAGGSGTGAVSFAASGACSNVSGGALMTMIGGTGNCTITATKAGDFDFTPITSDPVTVTATKAISATAIASSLNPATYGQSVTLTVTVTSGAGVPVGSVTFSDGAAVLGSGVLNGSGQAALAVSLGAGAHSLSASYAGSANHAASASSVLSEPVATATTTTSLTSSVNPAGPNQQITFVATVVGQYGGALTGSVTFYRGNTAIGMAPVVSGSATLSTTLGSGTHTITATYSGDVNSTGSTSPALTQVVLAPSISTTTAVTSSLNPSLVGQPVTFTATVTPSTSGTPTGTVTFKLAQTELARVPLVGTQAAFTTSSLPAGALGITAVYNGDTQFLPSTSTSLTQTVNKLTPTITASATPNPATLQQQITLTVDVTTSNGVIPTGMVTVKNGPNNTVAIMTLDGAGHGTATIAAGVLPKTNNSLKFNYSGDDNNNLVNTTVVVKVQ